MAVSSRRKSDPPAVAKRSPVCGHPHAGKPPFLDSHALASQMSKEVSTFEVNNVVLAQLRTSRLPGVGAGVLALVGHVRWPGPVPAVTAESWHARNRTCGRWPPSEPYETRRRASAGTSRSSGAAVASWHVQRAADVTGGDAGDGCRSSSAAGTGGESSASSPAATAQDQLPRARAGLGPCLMEQRLGHRSRGLGVSAADFCHSFTSSRIPHQVSFPRLSHWTVHLGGRVRARGLRMSHRHPLCG